MQAQETTKKKPKTVPTKPRKATCAELFDQWYASLNQQQRAAVDHGEGPAAVAGCPGSGKTRVLITRLLKLFMDGVDPTKVCATTFSKAAASEIDKRLKAMNAPSTLRVGTLHSVAYEIMRKDGSEFGGYFNVANGPQLHFALKDILSRELKADDELDIRELEQWIEMAKMNLLATPAVYGAAGEACAAELRDFAYKHYDRYQAMLALKAYRRFEEVRKEKCLLTFSDMLLGACLTLRNEEVRQRWAHRFKYVLLDEAHDSNTAQIELVNTLAEGYNNLMVFHSVSQSIYAWRGAQPIKLLEMTKDYDLYRLPLSYRCNSRIADAASDLVEDADWNIEGRIIPLRTDTPAPDSLRFISATDARQEAGEIAGEIERLHNEKDVKYGSHVILYRTTALLLEPELALLRKKIPYRVLAGSNFFGRVEVQDMISYLKVAAVQDKGELAAHRITNAPFRYISKTLIEQAKQTAVTQKIAYLDALVKTSLRANQRSRVDSLLRTIRVMNGKIVRGESPKDVLEYVLKSTGYLGWLAKAEGTGGANSEAPKAMYVHEFLRFAEGFDTVPELLNTIGELTSSLRSARRSKKQDHVTLSTLHSVKGLQFDRVYIIGAADTLLPHYLNANVDEERRLLYVGITRAKDYCTLSWPRRVATPRGILNVAPSPLLTKLRKRKHVEKTLKSTKEG